MKRNFYQVLGVDQKASPEKIKRAFRQAAKRYHPDVSPRDGEKFREVQEAYETLSDPERKALYDREMLDKRAPLRQPYSFRPARSYPSSLFGETDQFFERFEDSLMGAGSDFLEEWEQRDGEFSVEITLTPSEAKKGCKIPLQMPVWADCRRCRGTGYVRGLICGFCRGRGKEKLEKKMTLTIPAGVKNGMRISIPLGDLDLRRVYLVASLRVSQQSVIP
jgi:DnaJ-class molecular chaperone